MSVAVYKMAKKYYPRLWDLSRIMTLYSAGKLTQEEYEDIVGVVKEETKVEESTDTVVENGAG